MIKVKRKKLVTKLKFDGKAKEFLHSDAEITVLIASRGFGKSVVASYLTFTVPPIVDEA